MKASILKDKMGFVLILEHETEAEMEWIGYWEDTNDRIVRVMEYDDGPMFSW